MHIHVIYIYIHNMHRRTDARASPYAARSTHGYTDTHTHTGFRRRPATQELPLTQHGRRTETHRRIPATTGHARVSPNAARSTHGHTCHRAQDSGDDRPRKSFPLRSTVNAPIHISSSAGFRRRPATQESPLTQHGRRTDTHVIERRIPATTGHARASPYAARSTHRYTFHRAQDSGDDRPRQSRSTVDARTCSHTHTQRIPATTGHARASPYAARSTHRYTFHRAQDSGDDRPRQSRSTVDARTCSHTHTQRIPATTGHARASPYAARSTHRYTFHRAQDSGDDRPRQSRSTVDARTRSHTHTQRIPATTGHARASPYAARSTHGFTRSTQYPNATYCHKATTKCRNICIIHVSADMFTW